MRRLLAFGPGLQGRRQVKASLGPSLTHGACHSCASPVVAPWTGSDRTGAVGAVMVVDDGAVLSGVGSGATSPFDGARGTSLSSAARWPVQAVVSLSCGPAAVDPTPTNVTAPTKPTIALMNRRTACPAPPGHEWATAGG